MEHVTGNRAFTAQAATAWRPAPVIVLSIALHVIAALAFAVGPGQWPWILALVVSNHVALGALVLAPRSNLLGPNIVRLSETAAARGEISLTFDDGPDPEITPRVLDILEQHGARASFFCVGERAARFPRVVESIVRRGHSVENHSQRHSHAFAFYGLGRLRRDIRTTQMVLTQITGRRPEYFRAPAGFRSVLLDPVLADCGLRYVSWTRRGFDAVSSDAARVVERLVDTLRAGDILLLHDGARAGAGEPTVLKVLPQLLSELSQRGLKSVPLPAALGDG